MNGCSAGKIDLLRKDYVIRIKDSSRGRFCVTFWLSFWPYKGQRGYFFSDFNQYIDKPTEIDGLNTKKDYPN